MDKKFLESLSIPDLVVLQHALKRFPEDKKERDTVLEEIRVRYKAQIKVEEVKE